MKSPALIIIGPSGSGKGSLIRRLRGHHQEFRLAISWTTRAPRNEDNGIYVYKTREEFESAVARGEFLEHSEHYGDCYGTPRSELIDGTTTLIEIEINGAEQIRREMPDIPIFFIMPPSLEELERRIRKREPDLPEKKVQRRLQKAVTELEIGPRIADIVIFNDTGEAEFERAYKEFEEMLCSFGIPSVGIEPTLGD